MLDTLRLVSSEDVGRDEANVQSLLKKHKEVHINTYYFILQFYVIQSLQLNIILKFKILFNYWYLGHIFI